MMVTIHLADGKKITKDDSKLRYFTGSTAQAANALPVVLEGVITINLDNVLYMRPAEKEEIEYAKAHGW